MLNPNAPGKGQLKTVDPIRDLDDIKAIIKNLDDKPRDHLLFVMGVNNGLRTIDILKIKVKDVKYRKINESFGIVESKTKKKNFLHINSKVYESLHRYLNYSKLHDDDFLFTSRKGSSQITVIHASRLIKQWTKNIGLKGRYGAHTLRKTWGYIQRVYYNVPFEIICKRFLHKNPSTTMVYLGIQDAEVKNVLKNEIG